MLAQEALGELFLMWLLAKGSKHVKTRLYHTVRLPTLPSTMLMA